MDVAALKTNLRTQLEELEALQSMFCNPGELRIEDPTVLPQIVDFLEDDSDRKSTEVPPFLDLIVNLSIDETKFELCINLSNEYPQTEPDIYVRNHRLGKKEHAAVNKDLTEYLGGLERGTPCIFSAISWLQDESQKYLSEALLSNNQGGEVGDSGENKSKDIANDSLVRYWIYSHHIYSKSKRREILNQAEALNISGFCMPGKPGIVCVEGKSSDCGEWWQIIKSMNWKRIFCKVTEECVDCDDETNFRRFRTFDEVVFQNNSIKCNHMDMGELYKFLEGHECGYIFKELFGVEAKS